MHNFKLFSSDFQPHDMNEPTLKQGDIATRDLEEGRAPIALPSGMTTAFNEVVLISMHRLLAHGDLDTSRLSFRNSAHHLFVPSEIEILPFGPPFTMWHRNYQPLSQDKSEGYPNNAERWGPNMILFYFVAAPS